MEGSFPKGAFSFLLGSRRLSLHRLPGPQHWRELGYPRPPWTASWGSTSGLRWRPGLALWPRETGAFRMPRTSFILRPLLAPPGLPTGGAPSSLLLSHRGSHPGVAEPAHSSPADPGTGFLWQGWEEESQAGARFPWGAGGGWGQTRGKRPIRLCFASSFVQQIFPGSLGSFLGPGGREVVKMNQVWFLPLEFAGHKGGWCK